MTMAKLILFFVCVIYVGCKPRFYSFLKIM